MATVGHATGDRRDARLTEEGIYAAALGLIDRDGIEALSMRKLAAVLGVNPMSLYHHVPNKAALLRGVTNLVARQFRSKSGDGDWREQLHRVAHDFRTLAHEHPNLIVHSFAKPDSIDQEDPFWTALTGILHTAGVPSTEVAPVAAVITSLFSGFLIAELNGALGRLAAMHPTLGSAEPAGASGAVADGERSFELAVQTLIAGLDAELTRAGRSVTG